MRKRRRHRSVRSTQILECRSLLTAFTPGNIVVSNSPFGDVPLISEYTPEGSFVQSFEIPRENFNSERPRDIAIGTDGHAWIYDGTFDPNLTELDPVNGNVDTSRTFANWSTANNLRYGGVAIYGDDAFVTDTKTASDAESDVGLVRFDLNGNSAQRFGSSQGSMIDVAVGSDGKVYGLGPAGSPSGTHVHVFDAESLEFERTIELPHGVAAIAVNSAGVILGAADDIRRFNQDGEQIGDPLSSDGLTFADIDLDGAGNVLLASSNGTIALTTEALTSLTTFVARESNFTNFAGWVPIVPTLRLNTQGNQIAENGAARTVMLSRTGPVAQSLQVDLASSDLSELTVPEQVVIPAGATSVEFLMTPMDDQIADGTQVVRLTAMASNVQAANADVEVTDNESPAVEFQLSTNRLEEGGRSATVNLFRNSSIDSALLVELSVSVDGQLNLPETVTFPIGASSIEFALGVIEEQIVDGDVDVQLTASAAGHASFSDAIEVIDNDVAALTLTPAETSISENGGAVTVTVIRNVESNEPLVVNLENSQSSAVSMPTSVTIAGGAESATFQVQAIDNTNAFGNVAVTLTASGQDVQSATSVVEIIDDDDRALEWELSNTEVSENAGFLTARVFRNTPNLEALTVQLVGAPDLLISVNESVVIPAGQQASDAFAVTVFDDQLVNGDRTALLTASASEFVSAQSQVVVIDDDLPTVEVEFASATVSENGGQTTFVVRRNMQTNQSLEVSLSSSPIGFVDHPLSVSIAAGELESEPITISSIDNNDFNGTVTVLVTAVIADIFGTAELLIEEDDQPGLSIQLSTLELAEGGGHVLGSVLREGDVSEELIVNLQSDSGDDLVFPNTLTIAAGQNESPPFQLTPIDDDLHEGAETIVLSVTADGLRDGSVTIELEDNDLPSRSPGNVDGDEDFDGNDTFLILLSLLSASETQLEDFRGLSEFSGGEIRGHVNALGTDGDVDGNGVFDANDGFLMLLVTLSAVNDQIDLQKGASPLTAQQIRANVQRLGTTNGQSSFRRTGDALSLLQMQLPERTRLFGSGENDTQTVLPTETIEFSIGADDFWVDDRQWLKVLR